MPRPKRNRSERSRCGRRSRACPRRKKAFGFCGSTGRLAGSHAQGKDAVAGPSKADGQGRRWIEVTEFSPPSTKQSAASNGRVLHLERIQAQLPDDAALIAWVQQAKSEGALKPTHEHWACVVRHSGEPVWVRILSGVQGGDRTAENDDTLDRFREMLSQRPDSQPGRWRDFARVLSLQWLGPLEPHLASRGDLPAVTRLIVLPSPALSGVPIEALADSPADKRPRYIVSYAPSARIFAWIRGRPRESAGSSRAPRLLALGDPLFTAADDVQPSGSSSSPVERASQAPTPRETPRQLPGTRREVLAIARLFDRPDTLLGSDASEQRLDALASSGRLRSSISSTWLPTARSTAGTPSARPSSWPGTNCPTRSSKFATEKSSTTGSYRPSRFSTPGTSTRTWSR